MDGFQFIVFFVTRVSFIYSLFISFVQQGILHTPSAITFIISCGECVAMADLLSVSDASSLQQYYSYTTMNKMYLSLLLAINAIVIVESFTNCNSKIPLKKLSPISFSSVRITAVASSITTNTQEDTSSSVDDGKDTLLQLSNYQQVKHLNASAKKRSMIFTLLIVLRKSLLYIVTVYGGLQWQCLDDLQYSLTLTIFCQLSQQYTL